MAGRHKQAFSWNNDEEAGRQLLISQTKGQRDQVILADRNYNRLRSCETSSTRIRL